MLICGEPGTGKTTCVNHVLANLDEQTTVKPVYINCWRYNTRSALLPHLLNQLGYPTPRKGKPADQLLIRFSEWLTKNRSIVIALDEFDQLRDQTELVYDLHQLNNESENILGLLLISNKPPSELSLDPRSASRLTYHTIQFRPYDEPALIEILTAHADQLFQPDIVSEDALHAIAGHVADEHGDCRRAINLLKQAGRIAEREGNDVVTAGHVDRAWKSSYSDRNKTG
jgi:cell division control protein 6